VRKYSDNMSDCEWSVMCTDTVTEGVVFSEWLIDLRPCQHNSGYMDGIVCGQCDV